jgi:hypothetical protein
MITISTRSKFSLQLYPAAAKVKNSGGELPLHLVIIRAVGQTIFDVTVW